MTLLNVLPKNSQTFILESYGPIGKTIALNGEPKRYDSLSYTKGDFDPTIGSNLLFVDQTSESRNEQNALYDVCPSSLQFL